MDSQQCNCCGVHELCDIQYTRTHTGKGIMKDIASEFYYKEVSRKPGRWEATAGGYSYGRYIPGEIISSKMVFTLPCAHFMFTDAHDRRYRYGANLYNYIRKHKLGTVVKSVKRQNPNSGNSVVAYLWTPNKKAMKAWCQKNLKPKNVDI